MKSLSNILLFSLLFLIPLGCTKEKDQATNTNTNNPGPVDNETTSATDAVFALSCFNDLFIMGDQASTNSLISYRNENAHSLLSSCATLAFDTAAPLDADSITIDFGTTNCLCADGRYRRGKINILYSSSTFPMHYRDSGVTSTFTFFNYFVNDNQVTGTKTILNKGHITNNALTYQITESGSVILTNNAGTFTLNESSTYVMLNGEIVYNGPIAWNVAKFSITGNASGITASGETYTATIINPLLRDLSCGAYRRHFTQGKINFTPASRLTRLIDLGNGLCDGLATATIASNIYTIILR